MAKIIPKAKLFTFDSQKSFNENIKPHKIKEVLNDFLDTIQKDCRENNRTTNPKDPINKSKKPITNQLAPIILWGPPGIGKSSIVAEVCKDRNIGFVDVRLAQKDPVDMRGIPFPDENNRSVDWYLSSEWPRGQRENQVISMIDTKGILRHIRKEQNDGFSSLSAKIKDYESKGWQKADRPSQRTFNVLESNQIDTKQQMTIEVVEAFRPTHEYLQYSQDEDWKDPENRIKYGIIFFDEITAANESLQVAAYEMILDRKLGNDYKIPPGWYVCAAGNRAEDKSVSKPMSAALANRFLHMAVVKDIPSWMEWAAINQINPIVTTYICYNTKYLHYMFDDPLDEIKTDLGGVLLQKGWASPRAWSKVSACLDTFLPKVQQETTKGSLATPLYFNLLKKTIAGLIGDQAQGSFLNDQPPGFYDVNFTKGFIGNKEYNTFEKIIDSLLTTKSKSGGSTKKSNQADLGDIWNAATTMKVIQAKQGLDEFYNSNITAQVRDLANSIKDAMSSDKDVERNTNILNNYLAFSEYAQLTKPIVNDVDLVPLFYMYKIALVNHLVHKIFQDADYADFGSISKGLDCLIEIAIFEHEQYKIAKGKMREYYQTFTCIYEIIEKSIFSVVSSVGKFIVQYKDDSKSLYNQAEYQAILTIMRGGSQARVRRNPKAIAQEFNFNSFQKMRHCSLIAESHPLLYIKVDDDLMSNSNEIRNHIGKRYNVENDRTSKSKLDEYAWHRDEHDDDVDDGRFEQPIRGVGRYEQSKRNVEYQSPLIKRPKAQEEDF